MVSNEDREALAAKLVEHFHPEQRDPLYVSEFERRGMRIPPPVDQSTFAFVDSGDDGRSLRALTYGEIADFLVSHGWGPRPTVSMERLTKYARMASRKANPNAAFRTVCDAYLRECGIEVTSD